MGTWHVLTQTLLGSGVATPVVMDISNQNKLSEFYEELKRLNVNIVRPDINKCFADFRADDNNFYYALGGIKSVG